MKRNRARSLIMAEGPVNTPGLMRAVPSGASLIRRPRHRGALPPRRPRRVARALRSLRADRLPVPVGVRRPDRGARGRLPGGVRRRLPEPGSVPGRGAPVDLDLSDRRAPRRPHRPPSPRARTCCRRSLVREPPPPPAPDPSERSERLQLLDELVEQAVAQEAAGAGAVRDRRRADRGGRQDRGLPREHGLVAAALRARRADGDGQAEGRDDPASTAGPTVRTTVSARVCVARSTRRRCAAPTT